MFAKSFVLFGFLPIIIATPLSGVSDSLSALKASSYCGQHDSVTAGSYYTLLLDQWNVSDATYGSCCASLMYVKGTTVAWKNVWNWGGGSRVKSFTNMQLNSGLNKQLSAIKSIWAIWEWQQISSGTVVSNVAYDLFTSYTPGGSNVNEIMIWLADFNAGPISRAYDSKGQASPAATNIFLAGYTWKLYCGYNGANNVFTFLPSDGGHIRKFKADLNVFLKYLTQTRFISNGEFIKTAQGGSEATLGSATFVTSAYSLAIN